MQLTPEQVKGKIKNIAKEKKADARILMRLHMMERFLERVSLSRYKDNFIMKGGMLVTAMVGVSLRSTMDIDTSIKNQNLSAEDARAQAAEIKAKVLSNRKPPYSLAGGLFDALNDAGGDIFKVTNAEIDIWKEKFLKLEGIDIYSAASVAVASLAKAVESGDVRKDEVIMLNITGGGESLTKEHHDVVYAKPDLVIDTFLPAEEIIRQVEKLF